MAEPHKCSVCFDELTDQRWTLIAGDLTCIQCVKDQIVPQFFDAVKYEAKYPVMWGRTELDPSAFKGFIPGYETFLAQWQEKEREYRTPGKERVYCACGKFLSPIISYGAPSDRFFVSNSQFMILSSNFISSNPQLPASSQVLCPDCDTHTCGTCHESITRNGGQHVCATQETATDPFLSFVAGKEYQACPSCGLEGFINNGCNAIECAAPHCRSQFCFICGRLAAENSGHWNLGKPCPRWDRPGAENANHDAQEDLVVFEGNAVLAQLNPDEILIFARRPAWAHALFIMRTETTVGINAGLSSDPPRQRSDNPHIVRRTALLRLVVTDQILLLDELRSSITRLQVENLRQNRLPHPWLTLMFGLLSRLTENIAMYAYPQLFYARRHEYTKRHTKISCILCLYRDPMTQRFPILQEILHMYSHASKLYFGEYVVMKI